MDTSGPLPPLHEVFEGNREARNAYVRLLLLEDQAVIPIRMLSQVLQAPPFEGLDFIATRINELPTDQGIFQLASSYLDYFIGYFQSEQPFAEDLVLVWIISMTLTQALQDHSRAKELVLNRDNYGCIVTGLAHDASCETVPGLQAEVIIRYAATGHTECSHILPKYIGRDVDDPQKVDNRHTIDLNPSDYFPLFSVRVAHLSGAAEHIKRILCDEEKTKVLSGDRSSTRLASQLSHLSKTGCYRERLRAPCALANLPEALQA